MLLDGNDSRVLLTPRVKPSQAYTISLVSLIYQRHMADLTEFLKREREVRLWEKEEYLSCLLLGWALKHPHRSLLQPALDFLPPHTLSALPSVRKRIGSFPPDSFCIGPDHGMHRVSMEFIWSQVKKQACWGEAKCSPSVVSPVHCHSRLGYILQAGLQRDQGFNTLSLAPGAEF